jgi:outer membrane receptor protein involved in Fe transport
MRHAIAVAALVVLAGWIAMPETPTFGQQTPETKREKDNGEKEDQRRTGTKKKKKTDENKVNLEEVVVEAQRPLSAASSDEIRAKDYELRPHTTTMEILNNVPGLLALQHQGGAKAAQYLIRGFDADHGTDFAVFVDGLPVNLPTHGHGQGYADLNFLIPETVDRLQLYKGPYFADLGDFATAGALRIVTLDEFPENFARAEGGSWDTQRYVLGGSPKLPWAKTLLAAEAYFTNGPFDNPQNLARYNFFGKLTAEPVPGGQLRVSGSVYEADWDASGQIPAREVSNGDLDRFGAIDPTEGGKTDRENLNVTYTYSPNEQDEWAFQLYGSRYSLRLYSDFTFYQQSGLRFVRQADGQICDTTKEPCNLVGADYIPGDGIAQDDARLLFGARGSFSRFWNLFNVPLQSRIGIETRRDDIDVGLSQQVRRQIIFDVNRVGVGEQSVSGFLEQKVFFTKWLRLEAGLRGDVYFFDGRDRLPPQETDPNFQAVPISGNATNSIVSPKVNLILSPLESTDIYLNFGTGFHSNDARVVLQTNQNGLAQATGYELGARTHQFGRLDAAASLWLLDLDSELVFSGDGGRVETDVSGNYLPSRATRRWGVDFETRLQMTDWLFADYDLSWVDPRFRTGPSAIPLAPTLLMNGGLTAQTHFGLSGALRVRFVDDRPANEENTLTARGFTLVDLIGRYRWRNLEASLALLNITDHDWRDAQFAGTSCVLGEEGSAACPTTGNGNGVEDVHFTPGQPLTVRAGLTAYF